MAKRAKKEPTREEKLQSFLKGKFGTYNPEPTYQFNIGDSVLIGNLQDATICDILENGVYEIDYTSIDNNYGKPIVKPHQRRFVHWYDIRPINDTQISLIQNDDLRLNFSSQDIGGGIIGRTTHFGIDFSPEYQRDYVWDLKDKVALIDSIFNNIDIGKFVFIHNDYGTNDNSYTVLDGKQRTLTLLEFFENRFAYKGLYYNDLCARDKSHFNGFTIAVAEIDEISEEQILRYFISLNTAGKVMDMKHIKALQSKYDSMKGSK